MSEELSQPSRVVTRRLDSALHAPRVAVQIAPPLAVIRAIPGTAVRPPDNFPCRPPFAPAPMPLRNRPTCGNTRALRKRRGPDRLMQGPHRAGVAPPHRAIVRM